MSETNKRQVNYKQDGARETRETRGRGRGFIGIAKQTGIARRWRYTQMIEESMQVGHIGGMRAGQGRAIEVRTAP